MSFARLALVAALSLPPLPALAQESDPAVMQPELPEGYPPKMGEVSGMVGDMAKLWETYDFSIGAFDASAWAEADRQTRVVGVHIMAFPPGEPDTLPGRIHAEAEFGTALQTGKGRKISVSIMKGEDLDGPRLSSKGQKARFVIESIGPAREDSYNRRVTGRIEARLCPVDWDGESCRDVALRFDTDMQLGSTVSVQE